jgi:glycosyltransferase involved in cell wall biosynthesis
MNIIIIQRIFPIYRKAIFDKLNKVYGIKIFHGKNNTGIKQIETTYSTPIKLTQIGQKDTVGFLYGFTKVWKEKPNIIFHEFTIGVLSLLPMRIVAFFLGSKFIIWGHNINLKRGFKPFSNISDFFRYVFMRTSHAVLFYSPDQMVPVKPYINNDKMFVAYNALDTDTQLATYKKIATSSREEVKASLNCNFQYNLIFISRLLPTKKPEQIIDIYAMLHASIRENVGVHIIGDGPMFSPLQQMIEKKGFNKNIKLYGEVTDEEKLGRLLYISDFMINPGYLGLSVNLSFAYGCPIITFENEAMEQVHSPEVYYLKDGQSGIIIKNLHLQEMADALSNSLLSKSYIKMRENCLTIIYNEGSIAQMFSGFEKAINFVQKK